MNRRGFLGLIAGAVLAPKEALRKCLTPVAKSRYAPKFLADAVLRKDEWMALDQAVLRASTLGPIVLHGTPRYTVRTGQSGHRC